MDFSPSSGPIQAYFEMRARHRPSLLVGRLPLWLAFAVPALGLLQLKPEIAGVYLCLSLALILLGLPCAIWAVEVSGNLRSLYRGRGLEEMLQSGVSGGEIVDTLARRATVQALTVAWPLMIPLLLAHDVLQAYLGPGYLAMMLSWLPCLLLGVFCGSYAVAYRCVARYRWMLLWPCIWALWPLLSAVAARLGLAFAFGLGTLPWTWWLRLRAIDGLQQQSAPRRRAEGPSLRGAAGGVSEGSGEASVYPSWLDRPLLFRERAREAISRPALLLRVALQLLPAALLLELYLNHGGASPVLTLHFGLAVYAALLWLVCGLQALEVTASEREHSRWEILLATCMSARDIKSGLIEVAVLPLRWLFVSVGAVMVPAAIWQNDFGVGPVLGAGWVLGLVCLAWFIGRMGAVVGIRQTLGTGSTDQARSRFLSLSLALWLRTGLGLGLVALVCALFGPFNPAPLLIAGPTVLALIVLVLLGTVWWEGDLHGSLLQSDQMGHAEASPGGISAVVLLALLAAAADQAFQALSALSGRFEVTGVDVAIYALVLAGLWVSLELLLGCLAPLVRPLRSGRPHGLATVAGIGLACGCAVAALPEAPNLYELYTGKSLAGLAQGLLAAHSFSTALSGLAGALLAGVLLRFRDARSYQGKTLSQAVRAALPGVLGSSVAAACLLGYATVLVQRAFEVPLVDEVRSNPDYLVAEATRNRIPAPRLNVHDLRLAVNDWRQGAEALERWLAQAGAVSAPFSDTPQRGEERFLALQELIQTSDRLAVEGNTTDARYLLDLAIRFASQGNQRATGHEMAGQVAYVGTLVHRMLDSAAEHPLSELEARRFSLHLSPEALGWDEANLERARWRHAVEWAHALQSAESPYEMGAAPLQEGCFGPLGAHYPDFWRRNAANYILDLNLPVVPLHWRPSALMPTAYVNLSRELALQGLPETVLLTHYLNKLQWLCQRSLKARPSHRPCTL